MQAVVGILKESEARQLETRDVEKAVLLRENRLHLHLSS